MIESTNVNADAQAVISLQTRDMPWKPMPYEGVSRKVMERINDPTKGRETALLKLEAGASLPQELLEERLDLFVIEGNFSDGHGEYGRHTFVRNVPGATIQISSNEGCTLYSKRRVSIPSINDERMVIDSETAQWAPFPQRGATVLHLYDDANGFETGRFGQIHPNRQLPSHDHTRGEETLIIGGLLVDEYTRYEPGAWFRMPIGVPHSPYSGDDGCLMLIREGDLVW